MLVLLLATLTAKSTDYYVRATGGLTSGTGSTPATALDYAYAITNSSITYVRDVDRLIYMAVGGTFTGTPNAAVGGGTNEFHFSATVTGAGSFVEHVPYWDGRPIVDTRKFRLVQTGHSFNDIEFTDSTRTNKVFTQTDQLSTAGSAYTLRVRNCIFRMTASSPSSCAFMIGCVAEQVGSDEKEHVIYAQATDAAQTPNWGNNISWGSGGEFGKLINASYNAQISSNLIINCGRYTWPDGPNSQIIHNPGSGFLAANHAHIWRNYIVVNSADTAATDIRPLLHIDFGTTDSTNLWIHHNLIQGPDGIVAVKLGNGTGNGANNYGLIFKTNTIAGPFTSAGYFARMVSSTTPQLSTADWDFNTYISGDSTKGVFQWNGTGINTSFESWTNQALGGPVGNWDMRSTITRSQSQLAGDKWEVMPDPITPGRGHLFALNNSGQTSHAFDLTPMGLADGQPYVIMFAGSIDNPATWATNTFTAASPNITVSLTTNSWPHTLWVPDGTGTNATTLTAPNSLPQIGAWVIYPAPTAPTFTVTASGDRTSRSISWSGSSRWGKVRIQRRVNGGAYSTLATVTLPTTSYSDSGLTSGSTYDYKLTAANGYAESKEFPSLDAGGPPPPPAPGGSGGLRGGLPIIVP